MFRFQWLFEIRFRFCVGPHFGIFFSMLDWASVSFWYWWSSEFRCLFRFNSRPNFGVGFHAILNLGISFGIGDHSSFVVCLVAMLDRILVSGSTLDRISASVYVQIVIFWSRPLGIRDREWYFAGFLQCAHHKHDLMTLILVAWRSTHHILSLTCLD